MRLPSQHVSEVRLDWHYPPLRRGPAGLLDRIVGPGASSAEVWLTFGTALLGGVSLMAYGLVTHVGWTPVQFAVAGLIAADTLGGIVSKATSSSKRWWHRQGQGIWQYLVFVAIHVYPFLIAWLFRSMDWTYAVVVYVYLLAGAGIVLSIPLYLQRALAMLLFCGALVLNSYVFPTTLALTWFIPFLSLKLLVCHVLREEPYRPAKERMTERICLPTQISK